MRTKTYLKPTYIPIYLPTNVRVVNVVTVVKVVTVVILVKVSE